MTDLGSLEATLSVAEAVVAELKAVQLDAVVIGAMALAVHGYPRDTVDFDLAVAADPRVLHDVAAALRKRGDVADVRDPDGQDPLGDVIDIAAAGASLIRVVNFSNPPSGGFPRLVTESLAAATLLAPGRTLRVVDVYHLIAFKLYAGGPKSKLDVLELLERQPTLDRARLGELCKGYGLAAELEAVLAL